jgi:anti-sigma B factor antagonist
MPEFHMEWLSDTEPGLRVMKLAGPFTLNAVFEFQNAVRQPSEALTIVDLTDVPYMDSAALGSLLGLHVSCQTHKRGYALVGVCDRLKTLFRVAGVTGVLVLADSVEQAKAASA